MAEPIAITGIGVASALGIGADAFWTGLCEGRVPIAPPTLFDASKMHCTLAAETPGFAIRDHLPKHYRKAAKVMVRDVGLAVAAAANAVHDAALVTPASEGEAADPTYASHRLGTHVGAGLIATDPGELARAMAGSADADGNWDMAAWGQGGMDALSPLWMLKYLPNMLACHISILHQAKGPSNTLLCAEASGLLSLGESVRIIERGMADACFAGSGDSRVNPVASQRVFLAGRYADTRGDDRPVDAWMRPFDPSAAGAVPGEGAAILVLERPGTPQAARAGATPRAMILGFGSAQAVPEGWGDAGSPPIAGLGRRAGGRPDGLDEGLARAITGALDDAGVSAGSIDAVFCHAACEPAMDEAEMHGLRLALGEHAETVELAWITPCVGECMAATGALQAAAAALSVQHQRLPARVQTGSPADGLNAAAAPARDAELGRVLVCTHGLGGQCGAVVIGRA
ncbi:MAG: beta-ketoacyl synthase N-terminal-like domain-containing protein [Planctomycetota bacterium]